MPSPPAYQPISCAQHSAFELAIMQRKSLELSWIDEHEKVHRATVRPLDLTTRKEGEFLLFLTKENRKEAVRLDKIL